MFVLVWTQSVGRLTTLNAMMAYSEALWIGFIFFQMVMARSLVSYGSPQSVMFWLPSTDTKYWQITLKVDPLSLHFGHLYHDKK